MGTLKQITNELTLQSISCSKNYLLRVSQEIKTILFSFPRRQQGQAVKWHLRD